MPAAEPVRRCFGRCQRRPPEAASDGGAWLGPDTAIIGASSSQGGQIFERPICRSGLQTSSSQREFVNQSHSSLRNMKRARLDWGTELCRLYTASSLRARSVRLSDRPLHHVLRPPRGVVARFPPRNYLQNMRPLSVDAKSIYFLSDVILYLRCKSSNILYKNGASARYKIVLSGQPVRPPT